MRSGRLRDKVFIQKKTTTEGEYGDLVDTYVFVLSPASRRCDIQPLNGREYFASRAEVNSLDYRIRFRYEAGILENGYRLLDTRVSPNRVFDIESVINESNKNVELICMCKERTYD